MSVPVAMDIKKKVTHVMILMNVYLKKTHVTLMLSAVILKGAMIVSVKMGMKETDLVVLI